MQQIDNPLKMMVVPDMYDEQSLINQAKGGDRAAFSELVRHHREGVINVVYRMCGDVHLAEDAAQEAFIRSWQHLPGYQPRSPFRNWLYRIATNEALMFLRKKRPVQVSVDEPLENDEGDERPRQIIDWCCLPEEEYLTAEGRLRLDQAAERLPESLRIAFVLRDIEGLSTRETAEVLQISEMAVKTRLSRARLRLREDLSMYDGAVVEKG